jgi:hypothetical protein
MVKQAQQTDTFGYSDDNTIDINTLSEEDIHVLSLKRLLQVVSTVQEDQNSILAITRYLEHYEQAQGENNEKKIEEIVVEWDLKLCDEGVEFVDTPGLFSRHENHNSITNRVLPQAHAILFLVEPDKTGEANFGRVIRDYVKEAKASNLDAQSNHIFFLVNKIDRYPRQFDAVCHELERWLVDILPNPKILRVSSYYAMKARQFQHGEISLQDLQMDMVIRIPDPSNPRYPLSGRDLTPDHIHNIIEHSYILDVERALGNYLDGRHQILVDNVYRTVEAIHRRSINALKQDIQLANSHLQKTQVDFGFRIDNVRKAMKDLNGELGMSADEVIRINLMDLSSVNSIPSEIADFLEVERGKIKKHIRKTIDEGWHEIKPRISESNAESRLDELIDETRSEMVTGVKGVLKQVFNKVLKPGVQRITREFQDIFERNNVAVNNILEEQLSIEAVTDNKDFGLDNLANSMERFIEETFTDILTGFDFSSAVKSASRSAEYFERKAGFWNWLKSIVGADEKVRKFDMVKFLSKLDDHINTMTTEARDHLDVVIDSVLKDLKPKIDDVRKAMERQTSEIIKFQQDRMDKHLIRMKNELGASEEELHRSIKHKKDALERIEDALSTIEAGESSYALEAVV